MLSWPQTDSTMIGIDVHPRTPLITSVPSMSGRPRSRMTTSGRSRATAASPDVPSAAVLTSNWRALRLIRSARRMDGSSSMTRTRVTAAAPGSLTRPELRAVLAEGDRQRHPDGQATARGVDGHDAAPHGLGEPLGHGQAEADAGVAVVEPLERLEDPLLELVVRDPGAVVDHLEQHGLAVRA